MLGAQASPPALVARNPDREGKDSLLSTEAYVQLNWLFSTRAGGDARAPSTMVSDFSQLLAFEDLRFCAKPAREKFQ